MNIDLHCHTSLSDGTLTPAELLDLAVQRGLDMLSITDHDSVDCYRHLEGLEHNLRLIRGIEFSTTWRNRAVHIVGLNIDLNNQRLLQGVKQQSTAREERAVKIAAKLQQLGFDNCLEGAKNQSLGGQIGRPHFAQYLVKIGAVANIQQAFKKYLGSGKAGDIKEHWASMGEVISWIRNAGGVAVLAHPTKYAMTRTKLCALLEDFVALGGQSMEVISGSQTTSITASMASLCETYKLLASCGSDFHSLDQPWAALGKVPELPSNCMPVWTRWQ